MSGPLNGVRVVELGAYTTGPLTARYLSNLGAEVIKVEPLKGEAVRGFAYKVSGISYIFHVHNVNKKGVALDTMDEQGKAVLLDIVATADVLIENFAFGSMAKWGFGYEAVREINPGLIYCSLSGFGPDRDLRAFDTVIQGMAGVMSQTGTSDGPPTKIGVSSADNMGSAAGVMAVAAALNHKRRTGRGQHINLSMHDIQGWLTSESWGLLDTETPPGRDGNHHFALAPQNLYETTDGMVVIEVETQRQLDALAEMLSIDRLAIGDAKAQETELDRRLSGWTRGRATMDALDLCRRHGVPAGKVQSMADVAENPFTWERGMLAELEHPVSGKLKLLGSPFKSSRSPGVLEVPAPVLGQHSEEVLRDLLGYDDDKIAQLAEEGVIGGGSD